MSEAPAVLREVLCCTDANDVSVEKDSQDYQERAGEEDSPGSMSMTSVGSGTTAFAETELSEVIAEGDVEAPILSSLPTVESGLGSTQTSERVPSAQLDDTVSSSEGSAVVEPKLSGKLLEGRAEAGASPAKEAPKHPSVAVGPPGADPKSVLPVGQPFNNELHTASDSSSAGTAEAPNPAPRWAPRPGQPPRGSTPAPRGRSGPRMGPRSAWPPQRQGQGPGQGVVHVPVRGPPPPPVFPSAPSQAYLPPARMYFPSPPPPPTPYLPHYAPGHFHPMAYSEWGGGVYIYPPGPVPPHLSAPEAFHGRQPWGQPQFGPPVWETQLSGPYAPVPPPQPFYQGSVGFHPWVSGPPMQMWPQQQAQQGLLPLNRRNHGRDTMRLPFSQGRRGRNSVGEKGPPAGDVEAGNRVPGDQERGLEGPPVRLRRLSVGGKRQEASIPPEADVQDEQAEAEVATAPEHTEATAAATPGTDAVTAGKADCPRALRCKPVCDLERLLLQFLPTLPLSPDGGRPEQDTSLVTSLTMHVCVCTLCRVTRF
jgi:hypothetical protein